MSETPMNATLSLERFAALADAYGGDVDAWPVGERDAARALLDADDRAGAILADARALDALLREAPVAAPDAALTGRVLAQAPRRVDWRDALAELLPFRAAWPAPALLSAALLAGLALGGLAPLDEFAGATEASVALGDAIAFGEDWLEETGS